MWSCHRLCNLIKMAAKLIYGKNKNKKGFEYLIYVMSFKIKGLLFFLIEGFINISIFFPAACSTEVFKIATR